MTLAEFVYRTVLRPAPLRNAAHAALRAIVPRELTVHGARVRLNPDDPVVSGALTLRVYERAEMRLFLKHLRPEGNVVDVGANVGLYTALAQASPGFAGAIAAFEPHPPSARLLRETVAANPAAASVRIVEAAASDDRGEARLHCNPHNFGDNRLTPVAAPGQAVTVPTCRIDDTVDFDRVHLFKIDVQGAEAAAVRGAARLLERSDDCVLLTEFWPQGIRNCGERPAAYLDLLRDLGFSLFELRRGRLAPADIPALTDRLRGDRYANLAGFKGGSAPG